MRTPFVYYGGKMNMAPWIISKFPPNYEKMHYVEPFAGGLAVLFAKKPSREESASDLDREIYAFWKCMKDPKTAKLLKKEGEDFIYNEHVFQNFVGPKAPPPKTDLDRARKVLYKIFVSLAGLNSFGFKRTVLKCRRMNAWIKFRKFDGYSRIQNVQFFNRSALRMIRDLDSKSTLFYLDPPYPQSHQEYSCQFSLADFYQMIEVLRRIKGKFLLSFYESKDMVLPKDGNFKIYTKRHVVKSTNMATKNIMKSRTESLLTNF